MLQNPNDSRRSSGFSLLEVLAASAVLLLLVTFLLIALNNSSRLLKRANAQIDSFQDARMAFDAVARSLRSATLNTYWDYDDPAQPTRYVRQSDLHFVIRPGETAGRGRDGIFFQSAKSYNSDQGGARSLTGLLNTCGFYVEYGDDAPPSGIPPRARYRLKQLLLPGEQMTAYRSKDPMDFRWFTSHWNEAVTLADNVILLLAWPKRKGPFAPGEADVENLTNDYSYNSRTASGDFPQPATANQMPPLVDLTMVAIDEVSARRLESGNSEPEQISSALEGLFELSTKESYEKDLAELESRLLEADPPIGFRIFRTTMPIEESKWSKD